MSFIKHTLQGLSLILGITACSHIFKVVLTFVLEVLKIVTYRLWLPIVDFHFGLPSTKVNAMSRTLRTQEGGAVNLLSSSTRTKPFNCLTGSLHEECRPSYFTFSPSYCRNEFSEVWTTHLFRVCSLLVERLRLRGVARPMADLSLQESSSVCLRVHYWNTEISSTHMR